MAQDGLAIERAEDFGRLAILLQELRRKALVGVQFTDIRPKVNAATARLESVPASPMSPTPAAAVCGSTEPPLIAAHHLAGERAGIHTRITLALVWPHGVLDD